METITLNNSTENDLGIIDAGGVAIDKGRIVETASSQLLERKFSASKHVLATGEIVLPGFVDPHTHLVFQGSREEEFQQRLGGDSYLDILRKGGGIMETVNKTRETSPPELLSIAQRRLNTMIEAGTTTIEIKSGYGLRLDEELKILRVIRQLKRQNPCRIAATFLGAHSIPTGTSPEEYTELVIEEMLPAVSREGLAEFCDVFCENGVFGPALSRKILRAGTRNGLRSKIHADQFTDSQGARIANEARATSADHLVHSKLEELERMTRTSVIPVLLPASSHSLLSDDYAPARNMLSKGLPVALGTDFSPSNWILGQLTVAAVAARGLRMKAAEIIRGITINAARALGLQQNVGSIAPRKRADIVILRVPSHKWLGYTYGEGLVDKVLIEGREIVREGKRIH
ncbi:imidazolonepropionase [archaeon 13_2_20CM_2_52_21]|nr:MAG: imidazolonepropionase [archaeon 13_2_20CM_2_52_21]OLD44878.1 MAG: imidazolonepropionase [archaeon 13_1_40CM_2_52_4]